MFPSDSPFRNPPAALEPKQLVAFDGLRFVFDMIDIAYAHLITELGGFSVSYRAEMPGQRSVASAFHNAWSAVDNLYRLYQLLHDIPRLKRTPELEVYYRAVAHVEDLRHGLQHVDERLASCAQSHTPLLGTLRWFFTPGDPATGGVALTLVSGAIRTGEPMLINPLGREYDVPIGLVTLDAFGSSIELSDVVERTRKVAFALDKSVKEAVGVVPKAGADLLIAVEMAFTGLAPTEPSKDAG